MPIVSPRSPGPLRSQRRQRPGVPETSRSADQLWELNRQAEADLRAGRLGETGHDGALAKLRAALAVQAWAVARAAGAGRGRKRH